VLLTLSGDEPADRGSIWPSGLRCRRPRGAKGAGPHFRM